MRFRTEHKLLSSFSYASLTDVVLQLLIFFLLSSSFVVQPGIKVLLPKAEAGEMDSARDIVISLTERGGIYVNNEIVSIETLGAKLSLALKGRYDQTVVINADRTVTIQTTVQVMDIAKGVGVSRFLIATQPIHQER
ncbi:MAG: biopolymer transporter ExbD [Ignavibacteria bacterium]|nr:biopolymer transporter ExbD [Ignavibacteria bacterium]